MMNWKTYKQKKGQALRLRSGQVTIEATIAFIACIVLVMGCFNIFLWLACNIRDRHIAYERGRIFTQDTVGQDHWSEGFYRPGQERPGGPQIGRRELAVFNAEDPYSHRRHR